MSTSQTSVSAGHFWNIIPAINKVSLYQEDEKQNYNFVIFEPLSHQNYFHLRSETITAFTTFSIFIFSFLLELWYLLEIYFYGFLYFIFNSVTSVITVALLILMLPPLRVIFFFLLGHYFPGPNLDKN